MEDLLNVLLSWVFLNNRLRGSTQHLVDWCYNVQHLIFSYETVSIQVVQSEYPLQLFLNTPSRHLWQDAKEVLKQTDPCWTTKRKSSEFLIFWTLLIICILKVVFRNLDPFPPSSMIIHSGIILKSVLRRNEANKHSKPNPKPNSICTDSRSVRPPWRRAPPFPRPTFSHILFSETDRCSHRRFGVSSTTTGWFCLVSTALVFVRYLSIYMLRQPPSVQDSRRLCRSLRGLLEKYPTVFFYANTWWIII